MPGRGDRAAGLLALGAFRQDELVGALLGWPTASRDWWPHRVSPALTATGTSTGCGTPSSSPSSTCIRTWQSADVGTDLLAEAERRLDLPRIVLSTHALNNHRAREFYRRRGFRVLAGPGWPTASSSSDAISAAERGPLLPDATGLKVRRMPRDSFDLWSMADLTTPFAVRTVATLRVADALRDGALDLADLAERCSARPDPLGRVLRFLVQRGLFEEPETDVFAANDAARGLRSDDPRGIREWLDLDGAVGRADLAFTALLDQVRGTSDAYPATFGQPFAEDLASDEELSASFDGLMETKTQGLAPVVATSYDWKRFERVADIGGGRGVLIGQILRTCPGVLGTVVDQPSTVEHAREYLRDQGVIDRAEAVSANFFDPLPVRADAYVLCDVLDDWDDDEAARILTRCAEAGGPDTSVVVVERLPEPDNMESFTEMDLRMMVYAGGRMRDRARTERVVASAGMFIAEVTQLDNDYCIIECLKDQ